jgi:hypothetical protein
MFLVAIIVDPTVRAYWFEALPAHGSKLVGTPTAATNSMPRSGFVQSSFADQSPKSAKVVLVLREQWARVFSNPLTFPKEVV